MADQPRRKRRTGYRPGAMSDDVRSALTAEVARLSALDDPADRIRAVSDLFAALDVELEQVAAIRFQAIRQLRSQGLTYNQIADRTGLSSARVAQLAREARAGGRVDRTHAED